MREAFLPVGMIDSVSLATGVATALPAGRARSENSLATATGVLGSSPSGANILLATPDGTVALYTSAANSFVTSRHDFTALSGAFAASDFGQYIVGNSILDASLVPSGTVSSSPLLTSGFSFVNQGGYMRGGRLCVLGRQHDAKSLPLRAERFHTSLRY